MIWHEARGMDRNAQKAIIHVMINRVHHPQFPDTIYENIFKPNQISYLNIMLTHPIKDEFVNLAEEALQECSNVEDSLFWWNPDIATNRWLETRTHVVWQGEHQFLK